MAKVDSISLNPKRITLRWSGMEGFGEYMLVLNNDGNIIEGYSECMDDNADKSFIKELLLSLVDKIKIVE